MILLLLEWANSITFSSATCLKDPTSGFHLKDLAKKWPGNYITTSPDSCGNSNGFRKNWRALRPNAFHWLWPKHHPNELHYHFLAKDQLTKGTTNPRKSNLCLAIFCYVFLGRVLFFSWLGLEVGLMIGVSPKLPCQKFHVWVAPQRWNHLKNPKQPLRTFNFHPLENFPAKKKKTKQNHLSCPFFFKKKWGENGENGVLSL